MGKRLKRMIGGALETASSHVVSFHTSTLLILGLLALVVVVGAVFYMKQSPSVVIVKDGDAVTVEAPGDPRFNPLSPERSYATGPDLRGYPSRPILAGMGATPINVFDTRNGSTRTVSTSGCLSCSRWN